MAKLEELEHVHVETRDEWRAWLERNHASSRGVWLVTWRKDSGRPRLAYEDLVEEALCFGWIDSTTGVIDEQRRRQLLTPRRPGSNWARSNKERVERLEAAGLMTDAGRRVVEAAKVDGSWKRLDDVEALVVPADLAAAFDAHPGSREHWERFPPSARRQILGWIVLAKRPDTRARRIEETVTRAAKGERAGQ